MLSRVVFLRPSDLVTTDMPDPLIDIEKKPKTPVKKKPAAPKKKVPTKSKSE